MTTIHAEKLAIEQRIQAIMDRPYHRLVHGEPVDGYLAQVLEFPGCITAGVTPLDAMQNLAEAMAGWLESALMHGDPIPEPACGVRLLEPQLVADGPG